MMRLRSPLPFFLGSLFLLLGLVSAMGYVQTRWRGVQNPTEVPTPVAAALAAQADLARKVAGMIPDITIEQAVAVDWSDTSLGCPQEGKVYAQVVTPGFRVLLLWHGQEYEYHTDLADSAAETRVVDCTTNLRRQDGQPRRE